MKSPITSAHLLWICTAVVSVHRFLASRYLPWARSELGDWWENAWTVDFGYGGSRIRRGGFHMIWQPLSHLSHGRLLLKARYPYAHVTDSALPAMMYPALRICAHPVRWREHWSASVNKRRKQLESPFPSWHLGWYTGCIHRDVLRLPFVERFKPRPQDHWLISRHLYLHDKASSSFSDL